MNSITEIFSDPRGYPFCDAEAQAFSRPFECDVSAWWQAAPQATWMILFAGVSLVSCTRLLQATFECVRLGLPFIPGGKRASVESWLSLAERSIGDQANRFNYLQVSDEVGAIQQEILDACNAGDTCNSLAAARATGAVATAIAATRHRDDRNGCVLVMNAALSQVAAAGYSDGGADARSVLQMQCADVIRRRIRADELFVTEQARTID